jgi:hypothetical protein
MSNRYKGAVISATPPTTTGGESGTASGAWTLEQQMQLQAAGLWPAQPTGPYIEEVFSTYLYTGNAGTQTVTNGIDLSTKGGMVWTKSRSNAYAHSIMDTVRGFNYSGTQTRRLDPSTTGSEADEAGNATQATPLSNGFSITTSGGGAINFYNASGATYASWTFREQPKFFDIVTYTGTGSVRTVAHNLGSIPGCIIVKAFSGTNAGIENWTVYHRSLGGTKALRLNTTSAEIEADSFWNNTDPTSTVFTVADNGAVNNNGLSYVAYLFAHDAGGFGLTGTDNVISCGSYTGTGATLNVSLGYEVQWVLIKPTSVTGNWTMMDNMRGMTQVGVDGTARLRPNTSEAETSLGGSYGAFPNATGFTVKSNPGVDDYNASGQTYIYIAIRRGPMRVPTSGTSVFNTQTYSGTNTNQTLTTGFPVSQYIIYNRDGGTYAWFDRLRGQIPFLNSTSTAAEDTSFSTTEMPKQDSNTSITLQGPYFNTSGQNRGIWAFQRAPSFFDEVCYTGTGANRTVAHNLGVAPELLIVKKRSATSNWPVYASSSGATNAGFLDDSGGFGAYGSTLWNNTTPTSSVFTVGTSDQVNGSGGTYVAYLFATCAGVSKVGSYTGTGAAQTINCGFTSGARFVLIKRTDSTGDWNVWDSARGIIPANDPYLALNSTAAEVTGTDYVDTTSVGFDITSTAPAAINANGGTYIFLAIA